MTMQQHFVTFYSPGTIVPEETTKPIDDWDVEAAKAMALDVNERHGARPFGFVFRTRAREDDELDSKVVATSDFYWLGGRVETLEEIEARADPKEETLRGNMRRNGYDKVVINDNSWRFTGPLQEGDTILDFAFPAPEPKTTPQPLDSKGS